MSIWHAHSDTATASHASHRREWLGFLRHLGEMVLAMMLGMALLGIPYGTVMAAIGYSHPTQQFPELSALVMTFNMTLPMVAWMRYRGHGWERSAEMAGAMILPAITLVSLCVVGMIPHRTLSGAVMILMIPAMLAVMLYRRADYLHEGANYKVASGPPASLSARAAPERTPGAREGRQTAHEGMPLDRDEKRNTRRVPMKVLRK